MQTHVYLRACPCGATSGTDPAYQQADTLGLSQFAPVNSGNIHTINYPDAPDVRRTAIDPYLWRGASMLGGGTLLYSSDLCGFQRVSHSSVAASVARTVQCFADFCENTHLARQAYERRSRFGTGW